MSAENIYGVIWAPCIRRDGAGCGLVFTSTRITGTRKSAWLRGFAGYIGPSSECSSRQIAKGKQVAAELMAEKEFEIPKVSVTKVLFKNPGLASNGHVILQSNQPEIRIDIINAPGDGSSIVVTRQLKVSLMVLAPDRVYNEETGALLYDEAKEKVAEKQEKKAEKKNHWW